MGKYLVQVLACLLASLVLAACADMDQPRDLYIDDRFDSKEEADIVAMIGEANKTSQELLGHDMITYKGRYHDADGFHLDDVEDGYNVVYKQISDDIDTDYLESASGHGRDDFYEAYTLRHDIIIFAYALPFSRPGGTDSDVCVPTWLKHRNPNKYRKDPVTSDDCGAAGYTMSGDKFQNVVLHEMGHFLGLEHVKDPQAEMYQMTKEGPNPSYRTTDKVAICCLFTCTTDKYQCDLSIVDGTP